MCHAYVLVVLLTFVPILGLCQSVKDGLSAWYENGLQLHAEFGTSCPDPPPKPPIGPFVSDGPESSPLSDVHSESRTDCPKPPIGPFVQHGTRDLEVFREKLEDFRNALEKVRDQSEDLRRQSQIDTEAHQKLMGHYRTGLKIYKEGISDYRGALKELKEAE